MIQSAVTKDGRRLTGYNSSQHNDNNNYSTSQNHHHSLYDDDLDDQQHNYYYDDDDDDDDDHEAPDEEEDEDDSGSVLSIPDPNINFDLVYALHTFAATVDGQASVVKGDALTLLDDSNSYWWLVKVLKTSEIGYIPAENIETPYERLARLNSHRNIELTRRDIQDAFPAPPSTKAKATKRVTLAKGVKFQAQVIFGGSSSDEEDDFAEEYEEWDEALLSSESDDMSSESDDYDYYSSHLSGNAHPPITNNNSNNHPNYPQQHDYSMHAPTTISQDEYSTQPQSIVPNNNTTSGSSSKATHVPPIVTQSLDRRPNGQHNSPISSHNNNSTIPTPRNMMDLEQPDTIKLSLTPSVARDDVLDNGYTAPGYGQPPLQQQQQQQYNHPHQQQQYHQSYQQQLQQQQKKSTSKLERILGDDESLSSPTSPRSPNSSKKSGIRKFFSRGSKDSVSNGKRKNSKTSSLGGDSILSESASLSSQSTSYSEHDRSGSLDSAMLLQTHSTPSLSDSNSRYYTPMEGPNSVMASPTSPSSLMLPSSFTSNPSPLDQPQSHLQHQHQHHQHHQHQPHHHHIEQPTTLMIHGDGIILGGDARPASVFTTTTAQEVIQQVMESFDHGSIESLEDHAMNYYLVVKGVDGDEYTLVPSDRPLSIYHSLTGYLNTPMPSLKKARRISQLMSTGSDVTTHIGGPSHPISPTSPTGLEASRTTVAFYLHSKRRTINDGGVIRIKVSLLQSEILDQDGLFGPGQTRVDKSLSVSHTGSIGDVAALILERFHLLNGVVDGSPDLNDQIKSLRLEGSSEGQVVVYRLNVFRNGQEFVLNVNDPITKAYDGTTMPPIHYSRNSNPDRSSTTSMSSIIHSPQADETFFILRRVHHAQGFPQTSHLENTTHQTPSQPPQRPARSHRPPVRQNTPMPLTKAMDMPDPIPTIHPLEMNNSRSDSPIDKTSSSPDPYDSRQTQHHTPSLQQNVYMDSNKEQLTPEEDGDVLLKLNEALDSLAHTRNSNEPLTEAITHHQQRTLMNAAASSENRSNSNTPPSQINTREQPSPSSITSSSAELPGLVMDDPPSMTSTASTITTSIVSTISDHSGNSTATMIANNNNNNNNKENSSRNRHGSIQSMLYWDDFGMDEMMTLIRGAAKCQETIERKEVEKKNRRSSRHYTASIRSEISEVFKDSHIQLEQLEKELDTLMAQAVKTYCR